MKASVIPGPTRTPTSPPGYPTQQGSAELRLFPTCTLFIRWRVLSVSHSIPLTPIIRRPPPLRATLCSRVFRLSRPRLGNDNHLMLYLSLLTLFVLNVSVLLVPKPNSPRGRRKPSQSKSRSCLSRRQQIKNRQLPLLPKPPLQLTRQLPKRLLTRRPPARLNQQMIRTW